MGMAIWFLVGFAAWIIIKIGFGELYVGDILLGMMCGITGPLVPLVIAAWYAGIGLEHVARILIWKRKDRP